jgi:hypothetical protein
MMVVVVIILTLPTNACKNRPDAHDDDSYIIPFQAI